MRKQEGKQSSYRDRTLSQEDKAAQAQPPLLGGVRGPCGPDDAQAAHVASDWPVRSEGAGTRELIGQKMCQST